jgi:hypothetical protein
MASTAQRIMIATLRDDIKKTVILRDELPALEPDEIRLSIDKVGLTANNLFYAQMGEAPFLKFFAVYPLEEKHKHLAILPAWGVATIIESKNSDFAVGEKYRGFLHMSNVAQMKARRTAAGFNAYGGKRDKLNQAYNGFIQLKESGSSPIRGSGIKSDLAMTSSPGALSGFIMYELLKMHDFYGGRSVVFTSASSKLSLATALELRKERESGSIEGLIGYTSASNADFVKSTGLYDTVLTYDQSIPPEAGAGHILVDVAGDATIYKRDKERFVKAFAVGGTHAKAKASTFTAFGLPGFLKMFIDMMGPQPIKNWASRNLNPQLEMFFAPTVIKELLDRWGQDEMDRKSDAALQGFVDSAVDRGWITVDRSENTDSIQAAYEKIVRGQVPPSEAIILSLAEDS